ncbi:MAG: FtsQ-type POTRA domain-containing protein [Oscillospiraceae bacterium]|nr:FtsQ-type POTRA domain-containing protein [Oscillospiraceae bacterium]
MPEFQYNRNRNTRELEKMSSRAERDARNARNSRNSQSERNARRSQRLQKSQHNPHEDIRPKVPKRTPRKAAIKAAQKKRGSVKSSGIGAPPVQQTRRLRKSYVIHVTMAAIFAVVVFAALSVTVLFNIRDVVVVGSDEYSADEIAAAGNVELGTNLLRFDTVRTSEDIQRALIQIESATVVRSFPSTVTITLKPAACAFSITDKKGTYWQVSEGGRIIDSSTKRPSGFVVSGFCPDNLQLGGSLITPDDEGEIDPAQEELAALAFRLSSLVDDKGFSATRADITDKFDIKLYYEKSERVEIQVGTPTNIEDKLTIADKLLTTEIETNENGILRVTSLNKAYFTPA